MLFRSRSEEQAVRITDDSFVGSDTLITADVLKAGINHLGNFDAIFCGANSIDGNTSQIAGKLGAMLNIATLTNASITSPSPEVLTAAAPTSQRTAPSRPPRSTSRASLVWVIGWTTGYQSLRATSMSSRHRHRQCFGLATNASNGE